MKGSSRSPTTILWAKLHAPRKRRHIVKRLRAEHGMRDVSYQVVRAYVAVRKPKIRVEVAGTGHLPADPLPGQQHIWLFRPV